MSDWLHNLPIFWMTFVVFGFTYLLAAGTFGLVETLANGERGYARRESSGVTRDIDRSNASVEGSVFGRALVALTTA
jgi:hypothetical protein